MTSGKYSSPEDVVAAAIMALDQLEQQTRIVRFPGPQMSLKPGPFLAFLIGAAAGVPLLLLLGHLMYLDKARVTDVSLSGQADFRDYYLQPALLGGVAGGIIGCAVWVTQTRRRVARAFWSSPGPYLAWWPASHPEARLWLLYWPPPADPREGWASVL